MQQKILDSPAHSSPVRSTDPINTAMLAGAALLATTALTAQTQTVTDIDVLNYALGLEHLEANFYTEGLKRFTPSDFASAAFAMNLGNPNDFFGDSLPGDVYAYLQLIRNHEQTHVRTLIRTIQSLGGTPKPACTYKFTYSSADEFLAVGKVLEDTGVTAYNGAIKLIRNASLVTAAATIATVEGRHAAYLRLITGDSPFPSAFDQAKTMQEITTAVMPFIVSCPA